jgi:hypothetical protein
MAGDDEADSPFSFDYEEFQVWYSDLSHRRLERARDQVQLQLNELLDGQLSPYSRARIRIAAARIKGPGRLWSKLGSKYGDAVATGPRPRRRPRRGRELDSNVGGEAGLGGAGIGLRRDPEVARRGGRRRMTAGVLGGTYVAGPRRCPLDIG